MLDIYEIFFMFYQTVAFRYTGSHMSCYLYLLLLTEIWLVLK